MGRVLCGVALLAAVLASAAYAAPRLQLGKTVLLAPRTKAHGCAPGTLPDRRCSPGAYYSGLTRAVICAPGFRTSQVRDVPQSERAAVELAYGLAARRYGHALEIDHVVPLELGGSNDPANLYPERALPQPGFHQKDVVENRLHDAVCAGRLRLATARRAIAANWLALYRAATAPPDGRRRGGASSPCLPVVGDLDCGQIPASEKPVRVTGSDPYRLDADHDGLGCE